MIEKKAGGTEESEVSPNKQQKELIENTDGLYLVDAGAGTGKTFTITRRYLRLLDQGVEPDDIFLCTFTRNAADEIAERIIQRSDVKAAKIYEAPISTFHSHCQKMLERHGFEAPQILGIDDHMTENIRVMESQIRERQEFEQFMQGFVEERSEYNEYYCTVRSYDELLDLVKSLAAKGVFPTEDGWFKNTEEYLDGDKEEFKQVFKQANQPVEKNGNTSQSRLRGRLNSMRYKNFLDDAPDIEEVRGGYGTKTVRRDFCDKAFDEDREDLKQFIHDLYFEYIKYCLSRNYLNFSFLMMFTYALLYEEPRVRREERFEYLMIDEFQDTNEIQFKLALLLAKKPNICAVGDWKQSIYSFQHASVENIQKFNERLKKYCEELNSDEKRVKFNPDSIQEIKLKQNYRSCQDILDFSEKSLDLPGNRYEQVRTPEITSLESQKQGQKSKIKKMVSEDEVEAVLHQIQQVVDNEDYIHEEDGEERTLGYGDIAVLTRTRTFGLELQEIARQHGIPVAYEGGVELFKTNPSILLLAWLRILNSNSRRGWAVVLEEAGYKLDEAKHVLEEEDHPEDMVEFRDELDELDSINAVARRVFRKYGISNAFTEKIIEVLENTFSSSFMNTGQLTQFMEKNIEEDEIYQVDNSEKQNTVKIQTIHAAKGLEYPAVFISDINQGKFPSNNSGNSAITYEDPIGLRQKKIYRKQEYAYSFDNWRTEILSKALTGDYDEERRLMYVAMTRAEQHLFLTAEEGRESSFFIELDKEPERVIPDLEEVEVEEEEHEVFEVDGDYRCPKKSSVHSELDIEDGGGKEHGQKVHEFAEKHINGEDVRPRDESERELKEFIDSLEGDLRSEVPVKIPMNKEGGKTVYSGKIDLLNVRDEKVKIIDFKTDDSDENSQEYRKQLELYKKAIEQLYPDRTVQASLFHV